MAGTAGWGTMCYLLLRAAAFGEVAPGVVDKFEAGIARLCANWGCWPVKSLWGGPSPGPGWGTIA